MAWKCEYCKKETFETKAKADAHEETCKNNPKIIASKGISEVRIVHHRFRIKEAFRLGFGISLGLIVGFILFWIILALLFSLGVIGLPKLFGF